MAIKALYIHIPFCKSRCPYCDFATTVPTSHERIDKYMDSLLQQIADIEPMLSSEPLSTMYIGGGTPSILGPERLKSLLDSLKSLFPTEGLVEFTLEANPESVSSQLLDIAVEGGISRISLGAQTFSPDGLSALGRIHTVGDTIEAAHLIKAKELDLAIDLMCGIPHQSIDEFADSVKMALRLNPEHISVYPLQVEPGTEFAVMVEREELEVDEDRAADEMVLAHELIEQAGYHRYEISNYARPGFEAVHNTHYWKGGAYLGLGPGAASALDMHDFKELAPALHITKLPQLKDIYRTRFAFTRSTARYLKALEKKDFDDKALNYDLLTEAEACLEDFMLAMRLTSGISRARFAYLRKRLEEYDVDLQSVLDDLLHEGYVTSVHMEGVFRYIPTVRGWLFGNELFGKIWDAREQALAVSDEEC